MRGSGGNLSDCGIFPDQPPNDLGFVLANNRPDLSREVMNSRGVFGWYAMLPEKTIALRFERPGLRNERNRVWPDGPATNPAAIGSPSKQATRRTSAAIHARDGRKPERIAEGPRLPSPTRSPHNARAERTRRCADPVRCGRQCGRSRSTYGAHQKCSITATSYLPRICRSNPANRSTNGGAFRNSRPAFRSTRA